MIFIFYFFVKQLWVSEVNNWWCSHRREEAWIPAATVTCQVRGEAWTSLWNISSSQYSQGNVQIYFEYSPPLRDRRLMFLFNQVKTKINICLRNHIATMEKLCYYLELIISNINGKLLKIILVIMAMIQTILLISIYKTEMMTTFKIIDINSLNMFFTQNGLKR